MKVTVVSRSGRVLVEALEMKNTDTVGDLKDRVKQSLKVGKERQRLTIDDPKGGKPVVLGQDDVQLRSIGSGRDMKVVFKDLGPQVAYRTVFIVEYLLPLSLYVLVFLARDKLFPAQGVPISRKDAFPSRAQTLALAYWVFHYLKRIAETVFVHKFSHATMPISGMVRNCTYYGLAGFVVSYFINHPAYTNPNLMPYQDVVFLALGMAMQGVNLGCHLHLASLRKEGDTGYRMPTWGPFRFIACPNYTAEIIGWICFSIATQTLPSVAFTLLGMYQMGQWAVQKYKRLRQQFKEAYPARYKMLPPFF